MPGEFALDVTNPVDAALMRVTVTGRVGRG